MEGVIIMKTLIITSIICISLYAGIDTIKNTTNTMTQYNQELNQAMKMARIGY